MLMRAARWFSSLVLLAALVCGPAAGYALAAIDTGPCAPEIEARIGLAISASDYEQALKATEELLRDSQNRFGKESRCYGAALSEHAVALQTLNRGLEARPLFEQAINLFRQYSGPQDPKFALVLSNAGINLFWLKNYAEAAALQEEALELRKNLRPANPASVADSLHNLADAYRYLGRSPADVKGLYESALNIKLSLPTADEVSIGLTRQDLASAEEQLGQFDEASRNLDEALRIYRKNFKPNDIRIAAILSRQGFLSFSSGNYKQAETKFNDALSLERNTATTQKATLAATLDDFAVNETQLGRYDQAKLLAQEALRIRRSFLPENHPTIARTLSNLSYLSLLTKDTGGALALAQQSSEIAIANAGIDQASKFRFQRHLLMLWSKMIEENSPTHSAALMEEAFTVSQRAIRSDTAATLARTAFRFSEKQPQLRDKLKELDDLDRSTEGLEQALTHSLTVSSDPSMESFSKLRIEISELAERRRFLLSDIRKTFPDYAKLIDPAPLSINSVQRVLEPNEALIEFVAGFEDVYVWCVTQDSVAWKKLSLSPPELRKSVEALRASLEVEPEDSTQSKQPLFSLRSANSLYDGLIGPIANQLKGKAKLLIVPSGPLIGLPLQLLVSSRPKVPEPTRSQPQAFKQADWLIRRFAISAIPSIESLESLRQHAVPSENRKPLIGFANPLPSPGFSVPKASEVESIAKTSRGLRISRNLPASIGETQDVRALRDFLAKHLLENSGPELQDIAKVLNADPNDLYIGARATETELKNKSNEAKLSSYRIIYFATHGYLAGSFNTSEPALALTVPDQATEFDDGLLTASEVAQLNLDADWVVLSACDTASGDGRGAEGLSGLARAFFHAGARALLVSNWSLDDLSAREIMKSTFQTLQKRVTTRRSEALRGAMLSQIDGAITSDRRWDAYPGRWAPFEVIGVD